MEAYRELDISESRGEATEVGKFLESKLDSMTTALRSSEEALKRYKERHQVAELQTETQQLIQQAAEFESLYQAAKTDLEANERRLVYLKGQLSESQRAVLDSKLTTPQIQELEKQLAQLMGEIAMLESQAKSQGLENRAFAIGQMRPKEEKLAGLQQMIVEERRKLVEAGMTTLNPLAFSETIVTSILERETENTSLKAKTAELKKVVDSYDRELASLPEKGLRLAELEREAQVKNNLYMMLSTKSEENRIVEAGQIGQVRIVDRAKPPKYPISPKKKMNLLLGIMVGLGLGIGLTFLREYLDNSVKTIEDVEHLGFPVLGSIPLITPQKAVKHIKDGDGEITRIESRLITHFAPKSPISEAYRSLRTNIQYADVDNPIRNVIITSSGPGEGKSTSVANLAITFAQRGARTLLVDTDLRRPVLHGIFSLSRNEGLTNVLVGKVDFKKAVQQTKIDNLDMITSGPLPPNPSELLSSNAMESFIQKTRDEYEITLFDSPPVIAVTDSAVLATRLDGVVLVMKSGETQRDALLRARQLLGNVNARIVGVLINGVNLENMYGSYYSYYHYYYYGDGKQKKKRRMKKVLA
jgi:tyrosine-protein kinase Etk/Wzc